jgi:hypothetical protein
MSQLERKIADLILLIPSDQQHFARKRIDNIIRVVSDSQIAELNWKSINGEVESLNEKLTNDMMKIICTLTLVDWDQMKGKCRKRELNDVRQIAMWIIRKGTSMSFYDVGKVFNRHHATVLHAVKNVEGLIQTDNIYRSTVAQILNKIDSQSLNRAFDLVMSDQNKVVKTYFIYAKANCTIENKKQVWHPEEITSSWMDAFEYAFHKYGQSFNIHEEIIK